MKSEYFYTMHDREKMSTKMPDAEGSEEGEIVDSDEEHNMRQRIRELEAKNDELEKIASISGDFTNQYKYSTDNPPHRNKLPNSKAGHILMSQKDVARIPSDASSISSEEMEPVRKRIKRKGRHSKKEHCKKYRSRSSSVHKHNHRTHKSENKLIRTEDCCRKRNKSHLRKSNSPIIINENILETISLDSDEDSDHHKRDESNSDYEGKDVSLYLNRDELRFALSRGRTKETKSTGNLLRERLYNGNVLLDHKENNNACDIIAGSLDDMKPTNKSNESELSLDNSDKEECATQEEQELRLIALKSAILKKHLARKKRNAEIAYSPTDFAPVAANPVITDDNMDVVEEELDDINDVMEISPINSPKLILSPSNEVEVDLTQDDFQTAGDNNSIDMDIAQSGSEEEFDNNKSDQWYPIETAPMTEQSIESNEALKYPLPIHYGIYVPEMQYQLPPPNAIIKHSEPIDIEEPITSHGMNTYANFVVDEKPPPPPSMYIEIIDDNDQPNLPMSTLNMFSNVFSNIKYDEEPPPPPPFFPQNESESAKNNIFERLGSKTETDLDNPPFAHHEPEPCSLLNQHQIDKQDDLSDGENNDSDEEASALRAVLLSKLQTAKSQKRECTVKKVSEQLLPNLEIVCQTEDKSDKNGVETVLQKALRRLKSNFTSSPLSPKENDTRAVRVKDDCINAATIMVEVLNPNADTEEHEELSTKCLPQLEKKTTSSRKKIIKKIKNIGSKQVSNLNNGVSTILSTPITAENLSELQAKESDISPNTKSEHTGETHESNNDPISNSLGLVESADVITNSLHKEETNEKELKDIATCFNIDKDNIPQSDLPIGSENQKDELKPKQKQSNLLVTKNVVSNENIKTKETILKRKRLNSSASSAVPTRVQPLSVKNNLIPSGMSSLKLAQNFLQSTLNKVRTTTRTTKIVRPNKVINKEITTKIKRSLTPAGSPTPSLKIQRTILNTSAKSTNSTISSTDVLPKITVKKLVINLRASDTETSDDELMKEVHVPVDSSLDRVKNIYNEISSPLELLMNSASCSPLRNKNSLPNETSVSLNSETPALSTPAKNAAFEQKLDAFLKGIRKKGSLETLTNQSQKCSPVKIKESAKIFNTPSAVRHLPLASQDEYRRLVHRMKLLEKQKQSKKTDEDVASETSKSKNIPVKNGLKLTEDKITEERTSTIRRNAQLKTLQSYENSFEQASDNIVKILNKSLSLVAEAKKAKIAKLRHEQRLQELRSEIAKIQALYEREERKFSSMKPHIGESNQFLTSLKKKRRNLMDNANKLGRSLNGDKYRLNNKTGEEIIAKSRQLHAEIKFVNSMKIENLENAILHLKSTKETVCDQSSAETVLSESKNKSKDIEDQCSQVVLDSQKEDSIVPFLETQNADEHTQEVESKNLNEHCTEQSGALANITPDENPKSQSPIPAEIMEDEMGVELKDQHEDNTVKNDDDECLASVSSNSVVPVYISPLDHFRHVYRNIDSNAIICPYEMWGKCADESCSYMHMTIGKRRGTELAFKPINAENH